MKKLITSKLTIVQTPFNLLENQKLLFSTCETIIDINLKIQISSDDLVNLCICT